jgi:ABC-type uncharacterized transport system permease subunit
MCTWLICAAPLTVGPVRCGLCAPSATPSLPSPSPLPLILLLLDEAEGAIDADQALQGSQLQFLSVRTSLYVREDVWIIKIER